MTSEPTTPQGAEPREDGWRGNIVVTRDLLCDASHWLGEYIGSLEDEALADKVQDVRHQVEMRIDHPDFVVSPTPKAEGGASAAKGEGVACRKCSAPRSVSPCHKCGGDLTPVAEGWEWPGLPDIDRIRALAREVGYGVGVHGSLERDFDLIAIPWTSEAVSPAALAAHIAAGLPGQVLDDKVQNKPSGRWSCNINPEGWLKMIDLSVMGPFAPGALLSVIDDKGFTTLHEPNEDGQPGDLVASVWRDDYLPSVRALQPSSAADAKPVGDAFDEQARIEYLRASRDGAADRADMLYRALVEVRDSVETYPLGDTETCMCGSPVEGHNVGSGHAPVSQADHAISLIVESIDKALGIAAIPDLKTERV